jgi:hypothetical protein
MSYKLQRKLPRDLRVMLGRAVWATCKDTGWDAVKVDEQTQGKKARRE